jgi:hypothetical protein
MKTTDIYRNETVEVESRINTINGRRKELFVKIPFHELGKKGLQSENNFHCRKACVL